MDIQHAFKDSKGRFLAKDKSGRYELHVNNRIFPADDIPREIALWEETLSKKIDLKLVTYKGGDDQGYYYSLSTYGFEVADKVNGT